MTKPTSAAPKQALPKQTLPKQTLPKQALPRQTLVVVESPTKAKTMKKYLGPGYEVLASKGHVKDLPKKMGVDVEHDFRETYQVIEGKEKVVADLKAAAAKSDQIFLATDPDREGEAIAVHISEELKSLERPMHRVLFHEITKKGIADGISHPQVLNMNLYEAQRTRRVLDRLVGYDVSALVWTKVAFGLSAGRVQSVALRLIVDREREIGAFKPDEYWNIAVSLLGAQKPGFVARLVSADGERLAVKDGETAGKVKADLEGAVFSVRAVAKKEQKRNAPAPYTTSKLQQDATNHLHFTAKRTMQVAQGLYEGIDLGKDGGPVGLITYMRTDSVRVADEAVVAVREEIEKLHGKAYLPEKPNVFKSRKAAQDAHEAIRPASLDLPPDLIKKHLKDEQYKLYKLIWDRFMASQMAPAVYDQTAVDVLAASSGAGPAFRKAYELRASGRVLKFAGWLEQYGKGLGRESLAGEEEASEGSEAKPSVEAEAQAAPPEDGQLPPLAEGEGLGKVDPPGVLAEQKFTQPPPRFNEGSLVRELEKRGIGRPSTYAEIISKVQARDYVEKIPGGGFKPSELGMIVVDGLVTSKLDFIDPGFTAKLEEELDEVEAGTLDRVALLGRFYARFKRQLDESKKAKRWNPEPVDTGVECDLCHEGTMHKRWSKNGWFLGCARYPKCKNTRNILVDGTEAPASRETIFNCEKCGTGKLVAKSGRFGEFLGCSNYPKCDFTRPMPLGLVCPKCKVGDIIEVKPKKRGGRTFYGCSKFSSEPSCDFKVWQRPVRQPCPKCHATFMVLGGNKKSPAITCFTEGCGYKLEITPEEAQVVSVLTPPDEIFIDLGGIPHPPLPPRPAPPADEKPAKKKKGARGGTAHVGAS